MYTCTLVHVETVASHHYTNRFGSHENQLASTERWKNIKQLLLKQTVETKSKKLWLAYHLIYGWFKDSLILWQII